MKFKKPSMKFNPALNKYEPDLPLKKSKQKTYVQWKSLIALIVLLILIFLVVLFINFYFS